MGKGSRQPAQAPPKSPQKANRLKRDTPFICNVKFRNSLPEVLPAGFTHVSQGWCTSPPGVPESYHHRGVCPCRCHATRRCWWRCSSPRGWRRSA